MAAISLRKEQNWMHPVVAFLFEELCSECEHQGSCPLRRRPASCRNCGPDTQRIPKTGTESVDFHRSSGLLRRSSWQCNIEQRWH